jgi:hypothetical protein
VNLAGLRTSRNEEEDESLETSNIGTKPALYIYPEGHDPLNVFDFEDLADDHLVVICKNINDSEKKVFVWKGRQFQDDEEVSDQ